MEQTVKKMDQKNGTLPVSSKNQNFFHQIAFFSNLMENLLNYYDTTCFF